MLECRRLDCTGCGVCSFECPTKAIKMESSIEGFCYPVVNETKCINCGLCNRSCPVITKKTENDESDCFAVQLKDKVALKNCASGGAFYGIARKVIEQKGCVFGVSVCEKPSHLIYIKASDFSDLDLLTGSKYYQCKLTDENYHEILESTKSMLTLVSGTPCMISAIKNMKGINHDNLLTFEILCQGVHDELVVNKYYKETERKYNSKIIKHIFRSKDFNVGRDYLNRYEFENGTVQHCIGGEDPLTLVFQRQIYLRESCYRCHYANENRVADFTGGDLWDYKSNLIKKNEGCSAVLCNSMRAKNFLLNVQDFIVEKIPVEKALEGNIPYHRPVKRPWCRNWSYKLLQSSILSANLVTKICCYKYYIKKLIRRK